MPSQLVQTFVYDSTVNVAVGPTSATHDFAGWLSDADNVTYQASETFAMPGQNVVLTAQWTIKTYTVTFDTQQPLATLVAPATGVAHGNTVGKPADPTFVGGVFEGWYKEAECLNEWNFGSDTVTSDITLYAKWALNTYTVRFDSQGGSAVNPITDVPFGSTITAPESPTFDGFRFKGWFTDPNCITAWNFGSDVVTGDMTLYAKWVIYTPDFVTVTFDYNDGRGVYTTVTVSYGDGQNGLGGYMPANPTGSSAFRGWNMSPNGSGAGFTASTAVTGDVTVYAQWDENDGYYRLSFNLNGAEGAPPTAQSLRAGSLATPVANPERTGYTFEGWNTAADGSGSGWDFTSTTMPARNVTLYAQWSGGTSAGSTTSTTTSTTSGSSQPVGGRQGGGNTINIGGASIPLIGGNAHWALVNLILTVVGMLVALITLIAFFVRKKEDTEEDENGEEVVVQEYKKHGGLKVLSALVAIVSVIVFIITENMRLPMAFVDKWTILMAILFVGQLLVTIIGRRRKKEDDDEEDGEGEMYGKTSPSYTTD